MEIINFTIFILSCLYLYRSTTHLILCFPFLLTTIREEENGGMNPGGGGSKNTAAPEQHAGLDSADILPGYVWESLMDPEGLPYQFQR